MIVGDVLSQRSQYTLVQFDRDRQLADITLRQHQSGHRLQCRQCVGSQRFLSEFEKGSTDL